jgi:hypothetical protein
MSREKSVEAAAAGFVFAVGVLVGALLTCVAVALTLPQALA